MSDILDIACDEAGHTGPDLLHKDQRFFAFSSVAISDVEAFEIVSKARTDHPVQMPELKPVQQGLQVQVWWPEPQQELQRFLKLFFQDRASHPFWSPVPLLLFREWHRVQIVKYFPVEQWFSPVGNKSGRHHWYSPGLRLQEQS